MNYLKPPVPRTWPHQATEEYSAVERFTTAAPPLPLSPKQDHLYHAVKKGRGDKAPLIKHSVLASGLQVRTRAGGRCKLVQDGTLSTPDCARRLRARSGSAAGQQARTGATQKSAALTTPNTTAKRSPDDPYLCARRQRAAALAPAAGRVVRARGAPRAAAPQQRAHRQLIAVSGEL